MKIGLIGGGRVGVSIFNLLKTKHRITGVYDINTRKQNRAARLLGVNKLALSDLCERSQAIFIATPDDEISNVYKKIKPMLNKTTFLYHFSGILTGNVFTRPRSVYCASAHPFATFPAIIVNKPKTPYCLFCEGDRNALNVLYQILPNRFFKIIKIKTKVKVFHHLSGVFASNLLIGLYSMARECAAIAWPKKIRDELIINIMTQTLTNIRKMGPHKALSGPLKRGDYTVIKKHLQALGRKGDLDKAYRALSKVLLHTMPKNKKSKRIAKILKN
ncbi:hypothetical protein A2Y85_00775 [candidate division WOR-3 bacterium RBG_13_43_14]|uniref:DUF2520 domain-containing protein n=1 Tax=candidate division WOR-3 bacterium RBG_13_43_14 TaxID=1802590 RepID=A0A1F4U5S4_UNCW3|nr:MAG: hypothetical protein A2Y85_00775 [candidate division WOR-3 bacterium RBG_13_43_14]